MPTDTYDLRAKYVQKFLTVISVESPVFPLLDRLCQILAHASISVTERVTTQYFAAKPVPRPLRLTLGANHPHTPTKLQG
jgi:hypothetical protein